MASDAHKDTQLNCTHNFLYVYLFFLQSARWISRCLQQHTTFFLSFWTGRDVPLRAQSDVRSRGLWAILQAAKHIYHTRSRGYFRHRFVTNDKWPLSKRLPSIPAREHSTSFECFLTGPQQETGKLQNVMSCTAYCRVLILSDKYGLSLPAELRYRCVCVCVICWLSYVIPLYGGTLWRSWLRHCATSRQVAGSIPDGVIGICHWHNTSGRTVALGLAQPLTEMSTKNVSWGVKAAGAWCWQPDHLHVSHV